MLKAPFPYFGGKSRVAQIIWKALGNPKHYIEPFFGSGAVLLNRPNYQETMTESVCDLNGFVSNAWRAMKYSPDKTAEWADYPVNHADLCARRRFLLANQKWLLENLIEDDMWHDPKLAGYWIWAASCWIGSGLTRPNAIPHIGHAGIDVRAIGQRPHLGDPGIGVHSIGQRPHIGHAGIDVHGIGKRPHLTDAGNGVHGKTKNIHAWFAELSMRLRNVRVVCGDWTRVCGGNWQDNRGVCGMFFDPPYAVKDRAAVYDCDDFNVAKDVTKWCAERGNNPRYRIVVAGYEEHEELLDYGWTMQKWKAHGGYANSAKKGSKAIGKENALRECLYISPHCIKTDSGENLI